MASAKYTFLENLYEYGMYVCMYVCVLCLYVCVCMLVCVYVCVYVYVYVSVLCVYVCMCVYVYVRMYVCVCRVCDDIQSSYLKQFTTFIHMAQFIKISR